jgi:hypothetical protein
VSASDGTAPRRVRVQGDLYHGRVPDGAVYVGRPAPGLQGSPYANPYKVRGDRTAAEAVSLFRQYVARRPELEESARRELAGRDLACWCRLPDPGAPDVCHGAALLELANGFTAAGAVAGPSAGHTWQASLFDLEAGE